MPEIAVYFSPTPEFFNEHIQAMRKPAILRRVDVGDCVEKWSPTYLIRKIGADRPIVVHESPHNRLRFLGKNFSYQTLPFGEFMNRVSGDGRLEENDERKYFYFRALAGNPRKSASDFRQEFPTINDDFIPPDVIDHFAYFSCVLRCGSADLGLWMHYDVVDNILIQVQGRKRAVLFDPEDFDYLYLEGDKSKIFDPENVDLKEFPLFAKATPYICEMEPGDILYIPAFWMHYMLSHDFSVAVNIFWFNLAKEFYDPKDTYGNKELQPYFRAAQGVDRALKQLDSLPVDVRRFYVRMLRTKIENYLIKIPPIQQNTEESEMDDEL